MCVPDGLLVSLRYLWIQMAASGCGEVGSQGDRSAGGCDGWIIRGLRGYHTREDRFFFGETGGGIQDTSEPDNDEQKAGKILRRNQTREIAWRVCCFNELNHRVTKQVRVIPAIKAPRHFI
jgi:hypothetical protein